jgi:hypothetical protein
MSTKASVFISYAHADEAWLERLRAHLAPLRQLGMIEEWHDRSIAPGSLWETEIAHELDRATVILALVSPSFINSAYIGGVEMSRAFERHARGEARIVPIILRPVDWEATRIGQLQALPRDGRAVLSHRDRDQALRDVARGLRRLLSTTSAPEASASFSDTAMVEAPLYLNHTSFLRPAKQREFQERTGIPIDHYDIRVIVDCDDESRLDAVKRVEYMYRQLQLIQRHRQHLLTHLQISR